MRKFLSLIVAAALVGTLAVETTSIDAQANETPECVDGSYLLDDEDSSEVTVESVARGTYLKSGTSRLLKAGTGKITAGGQTVAQKIVSTVSIGVRVQRLQNGSWVSYTSWPKTATNAAYVSTSKTFSVATGYYYRVYSTHTAVSDSSGSYTDGLYI